MTLIFSGSALQHVSDESWGLDNVKVELFRGPQPLGEQELAACWRAFVGSDAPKAIDAMWRLVLAGDQAVDVALREGVGPHVPEAAVRRLVAQMGSAEWARREDATRKLREMGRCVSPILTDALRLQISPEVRMRIEGLLKEFAGYHYGLPEVQCLRLIRLMELSGSPKAASVPPLPVGPAVRLPSLQD